MAELKGADRFDYEVVKLMRLMDTDDMTLQTLEVGLKANIPLWEADDPDFPSEEFIERIQQRVDIDSLLYQMVPLYSRYYTHEEIAGLIAFYETSLGRKRVKETPQMVQEMLVAFQTWLMSSLERFSEKNGF